MNFDKYYVIHLEKDELKKQIFLQNNQHTGIPFSFFKGVYGKEDDECQTIFKSYLEKPIGYEGCSSLEKLHKRKMIKSIGQIGYLQSMLCIFREAKKNNYKKIIIFDDDVILHKEFNFHFRSVLQKIGHFDVLRLGTTFHTIQSKQNFIKKPFFKSLDCDGSFATCFSESTYDFFISEIQNYNCPFDSGCLCDFKKKVPNSVDITVFPFLAIPDVFESSILQKRNLYTLAKKVQWDLNQFHFKNSLRKVSIIVPTFNAENTIINCIQSLLQQTYRNIEIIIVNDCSTDDTHIILQNFLKKYNGTIDIHYIKNEINKKCYATRNVGIRKATGDYIAFQDSDDVSLPYRIELQMNDIIKRNIQISTSGHYLLTQLPTIENINNIHDTVQKDIKLAYRNNPQSPNQLLHRNTHMAMVTTIFNREIFDTFGLYDETISHSLDLWYIMRIYMKKFNYSLEQLQNIVSLTKRSFFHTFIRSNKDSHSFLYYNNTLTYICSKRTIHNISHMTKKKEREREENYKSYIQKYNLK